MDRADAFSRFTQFETENEVFAKTVDGVYYWDRIRSELFASILEETGLFSTDRYTLSADERNLSDLVKKGLTRGLETLQTLPSSPVTDRNVDLLFVAASTSRRVQIDGEYWDVIVDPLADALDYKYTSLEKWHNVKDLCDGDLRTENTTYTDLLDLVSGFYRRVGKTPRLSRKSARELRGLEASLEEIFPVEVDIVGRVERELASRKFTKPIWETYLRRIDPDVLIIRYNPSKSTLIEVCGDLDIPVVEMQHGVASPYSTALSYDTPITGRVLSPDSFFAWGEYWTEKPDFLIDDVRVVGWPFLEEMAERYSGVCGDAILFISQPTSVETLSQMAVEVSEHTDRNVIYRLHPKERSHWKSQYPALRESDVEVDVGDKPLYHTMSRAEDQVGTGSTALYEGCSFGLRTFIYDDFDEKLHPWYDIDHAFVFSSVDELLRRMESKDRATVEGDRFFEPNAIANIERELEDICTMNPSSLSSS